MTNYVERDGMLIQRHKNGGSCCVPMSTENRDYKRIVLEVERGESVITLYSKTDTKKWACIRHKRNMLLTACDFTSMPDYPARDGWLDYRQALRDIPKTFSDPDNITWPELPTD